MSDQQQIDLEDGIQDALADELSALEAEAAPDAAALQAKEAAEVAQVTAQQEYAGLIKMVLTPLTQVLCPNWNIQPAEIDALTDAYATACADTWPGGVGEVGPWMGAAIMTAAVVGPRLGRPRRIEEEGNADGGTEDSER